MSKPVPDAVPVSNFYEAFRPRTPIEKAALVWRIPKAIPIVICKQASEQSTDGRA